MTKARVKKGSKEKREKANNVWVMELLSIKKYRDD